MCLKMQVWLALRGLDFSILGISCTLSASTLAFKNLRVFTRFLGLFEKHLTMTRQKLHIPFRCRRDDLGYLRLRITWNFVR